MKTKAITFIAMICLLLVGAVASPIGDAQALPKVIKQVVSVDGFNGQLSLMTTTDGQAKAVVMNSDVYMGSCADAIRYLDDNAIDLKSTSMYRLNRQTCKVEQKITVNKQYSCGPKVRWLSQLSPTALKVLYGIDNKADIVDDIRFDKKVKMNICNKLVDKWVEVN